MILRGLVRAVSPLLSFLYRSVCGAEKENDEQLSCMAVEAVIENSVPNVCAAVRRHDGGKSSLCSVTVHGLPLCTAFTPVDCARQTLHVYISSPYGTGGGQFDIMMRMESRLVSDGL